MTWKADPADAPKAPWHPVPLNEICILLAMALLAGGLLAFTGERRAIMVLGGFALMVLGAGELALREHLAGFRSHTTLLSGMAAVAVAAALYVTPLPQEAIIVVAAVVFGLCFRRLRRLFVARSGGVGFRA